MAENKDKEEKKTRLQFDGDNFEVWLNRITLKLQRKNLWEYCEKEIAEPEESKGDEHSKWLKESRRAMEYLFDGMTDKIVKTVHYEPTPYRVVMLKRKLTLLEVVAVEDVDAAQTEAEVEDEAEVVETVVVVVADEVLENVEVEDTDVASSQVDRESVITVAKKVIMFETAPI